eukprot:Rhum_TRINITY_DN12662_c1_g1::Rhum_TRINITY_DN12662_c1_g1_i1::g.53507::m.53507
MNGGGAPESSTVYKGFVRTWVASRGYGFVRCPEFKGDVFIHHTAVKGGDLIEDKEVTFTLDERGNRMRPGQRRVMSIEGPGVDLEGNLSKDLPQRKGATPNGAACYQCGESGHVARNCPTNKDYVHPADRDRDRRDSRDRGGKGDRDGRDGRGGDRGGDRDRDRDHDRSDYPAPNRRYSPDRRYSRDRPPSRDRYGGKGRGYSRDRSMDRGGGRGYSRDRSVGRGGGGGYGGPRGGDSRDRHHQHHHHAARDGDAGGRYSRDRYGGGGNHGFGGPGDRGITGGGYAPRDERAGYGGGGRYGDDRGHPSDRRDQAYPQDRPRMYSMERGGNGGPPRGSGGGGGGPPLGRDYHGRYVSRDRYQVRDRERPRSAERMRGGGDRGGGGGGGGGGDGGYSGGKGNYVAAPPVFDERGEVFRGSIMDGHRHPLAHLPIYDRCDSRDRNLRSRDRY